MTIRSPLLNNPAATPAPLTRRRARQLGLLALFVVATMGAGGAAAAQPLATSLRLVVPALADGHATVAVTLMLPRGTAAVDGRLLIDTSAAEVVGIAPDGGGVALSPIEIDGGYAFGAYGLNSRPAGTTLRVIITPEIAGQLELTVVIDAAANGAGQRIALASDTAGATLNVDRGVRHILPGLDRGQPRPTRAAGPTHDLVADGALGKLDLDVVRSAWELAHANNTVCGPAADNLAVSFGDGSADANGDGCIDIVDIQAVVAAQGIRVAPGHRGQTSDTIAGPNGSTSSASGLTASVGPAPAPLDAVDGATGQTFVVTSAYDTPDANNGDGRCADRKGRCTLRAAITEANWQPGPNRIEFNLSGRVPVQINLGTNPMALIQDRSGGLVIDGYSQPGSHPNTASVGSNARPGIIIHGRGNHPESWGLRISSANNVVRGILFNNLYRPVVVDGADAHDNVIAGNLFGYARSGKPTRYQQYSGVLLTSGASNNMVGGPALADRNVSGNGTKGIYLYGPGTEHNTVQNNVLCMRPNGKKVATCNVGIDLDFGPKNNLIGGPSPALRNVIGPTNNNGIEISHGWDPDNKPDPEGKWVLSGNEIVGNWIGFKGDGSYNAAFRSGRDLKPTDSAGVNLVDGVVDNTVDGNWIATVFDGIKMMFPNTTGNIVRNNTIGESPLGQPAPFDRIGISVRQGAAGETVTGNTIRNAGTYGVALAPSDVVHVRLSQNIITDMSGVAIYLAPDPTTPGDGANHLLAPPVISAATTVAASGTGLPGATVEVYKASRPAGQSGLPLAYLGSAVVAGNGSWSVALSVASGDRLTALQIAPNDDSSNLGTNVAATVGHLPAAPQANFSWTQQSGTLTVAFSDTSGGGAASTWAWDFGDAASATSQNPTHSYSVAGTYTVKLTASNAGGSSVSSKQVVVDPATTTTFVEDAFGRSVTNSWGSADKGGPYSVWGTAANYKVLNGAGSVLLPTPNSTAGALLNSISQRDVDIRFRVATDNVPTGGSLFIYAVARQTGAGEYRPRIILNANGTVSVNASVLVGTTENPLGAAVVIPGLTQAPGSFIWFRAQVSGANATTIRVKAWAAGQAEPSTWQFTATDSQASVQGPGAVGLRMWLGTAVTDWPIQVAIDDYTVGPG